MKLIKRGILSAVAPWMPVAVQTQSKASAQRPAWPAQQRSTALFACALVAACLGATWEKACGQTTNVVEAAVDRWKAAREA